MRSESTYSELETGYINYAYKGDLFETDVHSIPITLSFVGIVELSKKVSFRPEIGAGYMISFISSNGQDVSTSNWIETSAISASVLIKPGFTFVNEVSNHFHLHFGLSVLIAHSVEEIDFLEKMDVYFIPAIGFNYQF